MTKGKYDLQYRYIHTSYKSSLFSIIIYIYHKYIFTEKIVYDFHHKYIRYNMNATSEDMCAPT